jgi:cytochrome c peroxidase
MTITTGDSLPEARFIRMGAEGPEAVSLSQLTKGKRIALFAVPGAFTPTCSAAHVPSFIRAKDGFAEKGIDTIVCISVNDPFVMKAWGEQTGATDAGLHVLADADGSFTKAIGMDFDAPPAGLHGRSRRYSMLVDDGTVTELQVEESPGVCTVSDGEAILKLA